MRKRLLSERPACVVTAGHGGLEQHAHGRSKARSPQSELSLEVVGVPSGLSLLVSSASLSGVNVTGCEARSHALRQ